MKKKKVAKVTSLALASALLVGGIPFQSAASASTVESVSANLKNAKFVATKQVEATKLASAFISPKIETGSSNLVTVILTLASQPVAVGQYALKSGNSALAVESSESAIATEQATVQSKAKSLGINMKVGRQFNTVLNGMEVTVPANQIEKLATIPGVKSIFENRTYYNIPDQVPQVGTEPNIDSVPLDQIGARTAWAKGFTGKGLKIGVIDTGVDYLHPDLALAYKGGYNAKNHTNDPYEDIPHNGVAGSEHGTHVSGTIVGRAINPTSDIVQKGIAYESDLYSYKVLGYDPATGKSSGSSAEVIDGIEHAVKDGMDVINLSLGSDGEKDPNSPDAIAINNAVLSGVVAVIANGNAADKVPGQYYYSNGSPASSQLAISVGAADSAANHYTGSAVDSIVNKSHNLLTMAWTTGQEDFAAQLGTDPIEGVYVGLGFVGANPNSTEANPLPPIDDYAGKDVTGKIVFISRGIATFNDKIAQAKAHGAKAVVIFNGNGNTTTMQPILNDNDPAVATRKNNIGTFLGDSFEFFPTFDMAGSEGREIVNAMMANPDTPLTFSFGNFQKSVVAGDHMASFSSRGPLAGGNYDIKPDFVAPGVNILSTWPAYGKADPTASYSEAYNRISGTSMATPHVAGMALLVKQAHPDWTPFDIRAALANTATEISDASNKKYDVYSQGAGRTNVDKAIDTPAVLESVDQITILDKNLTRQNVTNFNDNVSFGLMQPGAAAKTETLQVKNTSGQNLTYTASVHMHPSVTSDPGHPIATPDVNNIDVSLAGLTNGTVSAKAGATQAFSLNLAPKAAAVAGVYEGEVLLEAAGQPSLHLPFVVNVGDDGVKSGFGLQDIKLTNETISPNGDGVKDTSDLSVKVSADNLNYLEVDVYGLDDEQIGTMAVKAEQDPVTGEYAPIAPGIVTFPLDGSYVDGTVDENGEPVLKHLAPGQYKVAVIGVHFNADGSYNSFHDVYHSFGVTDNSTAKEAVINAAESFQGNVTNTKEVNKPVLTFPTSADLSYKVIGSSNTEFINNDGVLVKTPSSGTQSVTLTVQVASIADPTITSTANVVVNLVPVQAKYLVFNKKTIDRTFGLTATVSLNDNPLVSPHYVGNTVVVFQLMKGTTPVAISAQSNVKVGQDLVAQFPGATGTDYWVKVSVADSLTPSLLNVGSSLSDSVELK